MADTHDTIDGLLAEFRGYSHGMPPSYHVTMSWHDFRVMLDRLEAAWKREKAATEADALAVGGIVEASHKRKSEPVPNRNKLGDCAKLREALLSCLDTICRIVWIDDPEYDEDGHYLGANYAAVSRDKARAALAAPPRNCDVYNNESCRMAYHLHGDGLMTMQAFADWLFAPATEKEGGNE